LDFQEIVYAYTGVPNIPANFVAAIGNTNFGSVGATLEGTGLAIGETAISVAVVDGHAPIFEYDGPRSGLADFADFRSLINDSANWKTQNGEFVDRDGISPDVPFSPRAFSVDPNTQFVEFSPGSLAVSHAEGNSGTTTFTFTVERTGGNA